MNLATATLIADRVMYSGSFTSVAAVVEHQTGLLAEYTHDQLMLYIALGGLTVAFIGMVVSATTQVVRAYNDRRHKRAMLQLRAREIALKSQD